MRPDRCVVCATDLPAGTVAIWDRTARTVTCETCSAGLQPAVDAPPPADPGPAAEPHVVAEIDRGEPAPGRVPPGARGEQAVAESLEKRTADGPAIVLHNRRMPGGRGDIDHIGIAPSRVFVIDAKDVAGRVEIKRPWFGQPKLLIRGRDRTKYIDGLDRQLAAVRQVLMTSGHEEVAVRGVLCFTKADLPLIGTLEMRGHLLLYRKALAKRLNATGPHDAAAIDALARCRATALPAA